MTWAEREQKISERRVERAARQCANFEVEPRKAPADRLSTKVRARLAERKEGRRGRSR